MKSISLYEDKNSVINMLAPMTKVIYIITALIVPFILSSRIISLAFIGISILILIIGKVLKKIVPIVGFSAIIVLSVIIIQGLFRAGNVTPLFSIGPAIFYKEGLLFALDIGINILNILLSFSVLVLTTKPSDLVEDFVRIGLSPRFGYVLISLFQIIPQMTETMATITDAQRSRGMETEGNLITRIRAFFPLISPVVMSSLVNTRERAIALEVRGFNSKEKKTFLNEEHKTRMDIVIRIILVFAIVISIIGKVIIWLR
ncbi:CbiQ family ECF transporter T component [Clostridium saccharobutylicum]|uniref:CbiQ family ECF transporter T component n=1 Tax=Clostridium saccharobutylicum TaxID=169679 RepID=UPI0015705C8D|nr:energy-coupling factor transport system permease protein [Clostridium saccharobutylicum]NYC30892.1 energy-coupling factor transport system permease protein [Clostridium saccharobutylicum]